MPPEVSSFHFLKKKSVKIFLDSAQTKNFQGALYESNQWFEDQIEINQYSPYSLMKNVDL